METIAQTVPSSDLALILGAFAGMLVAFYGLLRFVLKQSSDDRADDRNERKEFLDVLETLTEGIGVLSRNSDRNAKAQAEVAKAIKQGNREAKERNGHLGEQNERIAQLIVQSKDDIQALADRNLQATKKIKTQKVEHQVVEHETVKEKS